MHWDDPEVVVALAAVVAALIATVVAAIVATKVGRREIRANDDRYALQRQHQLHDRHQDRIAEHYEAVARAAREIQKWADIQSGPYPYGNPAGAENQEYSIPSDPPALPDLPASASDEVERRCRAVSGAAMYLRANTFARGMVGPQSVGTYVNAQGDDYAQRQQKAYEFVCEAIDALLDQMTGELAIPQT